MHEPDEYDALYGQFRWHVPQRFNIAQVCCTRWARDTPDAIAIRAEHEDGTRLRVSYVQLQRQADRASNLLRRLGVQRGDRVAIVMPQRIETAVAHMAVYQLGAIAMPLSMLFGVDALAYRLRDSGAVCAIVDESAIDNLLAARPVVAALRQVVAVGGAHGRGDVDWLEALRAEAAAFDAVDTAADDAGVLIYTSGTTGPPKGALIAHRGLIGNLTGFVCSQNWFGFADPTIGPPSPGKGSGGRGASVQGRRPAAGPRTPSVFWSPADWAWTGGLMDALLPTLYFGREIVGYQGRFDPVKAFELMQRYRVTHAFLFPTALKAMMKAVPDPRERYELQLRAIMSAGEAVGDAVFHYCRERLGVTVNEMFGQTEINYIVGNCARALAGARRQHGPAVPGPPRRGDRRRRPRMPRAARRATWRCTGATSTATPTRCSSSATGRTTAATRAKFTGAPDDSWCRTGDIAVMDEQGYLWYQGRSDDMFKAAGYRIGPSEVENCLVKHPAVANAAVVPKPDAERGALVKAFVVLAPGFSRRRGADRAAAAARARQARALRVPEGDRIHRRVADDHHRQGAARGAAQAGGATRGCARRLSPGAAR